MSRRSAMRLAVILSTALGFGVAAAWDDLVEKKVAVVEPGRLVRGAWQRPGPLRRVIAREKIRTIVTLTAINRDDPKYVDQARIVRESGVDWVIVPMRGSQATLSQMAEAADLLADPRRRPVFFHCVAGHHRTSLAHAAYRIRHEGWSAEQAWDEVSALPWARPDADQTDRRLIEAFADAEHAKIRSWKDVDHARTPDSSLGGTTDRGGGARRAVLRGLPARDGQLRDGRPRPDLSLGPDAGG